MSNYVGQHEWEAEMRKSAGPALVDRIDRLRDSLAVVDASGDCGPAAVKLSPDTQIPDWLRSVLSQAELTEAEGPWPGWARCWSGVDWPHLINEHPGSICVDEYSLTHNNPGLTWSTVVEFWNVLRAKNLHAALDVELSINVDDAPGRIELFLYGLVAQIDSSQVADVTDWGVLPEPEIATDCSCGQPTLRWHFG